MLRSYEDYITVILGVITVLGFFFIAGKAKTSYDRFDFEASLNNVKSAAEKLGIRDNRTHYYEELILSLNER